MAIKGRDGEEFSIGGRESMPQEKPLRDLFPQGKEALGNLFNRGDRDGPITKPRDPNNLSFMDKIFMSFDKGTRDAQGNVTHTPWAKKEIDGKPTSSYMGPDFKYQGMANPVDDLKKVPSLLGALFSGLGGGGSGSNTSSANTAGGSGSQAPMSIAGTETNIDRALANPNTWYRNSNFESGPQDPRNAGYRVPDQIVDTPNFTDRYVGPTLPINERTQGDYAQINEKGLTNPVDDYNLRKLVAGTQPVDEGHLAANQAMQIENDWQNLLQGTGQDDIDKIRQQQIMDSYNQMEKNRLARQFGYDQGALRTDSDSINRSLAGIGTDAGALRTDLDNKLREINRITSLQKAGHIDPITGQYIYSQPFGDDQGALRTDADAQRRADEYASQFGYDQGALRTDSAQDKRDMAEAIRRALSLDASKKAMEGAYSTGMYSSGGPVYAAGGHSKVQTLDNVPNLMTDDPSVKDMATTLAYNTLADTASDKLKNAMSPNKSSGGPVYAYEGYRVPFADTADRTYASMLEDRNRYATTPSIMDSSGLAAGGTWMDTILAIAPFLFNKGGHVGPMYMGGGGATFPNRGYDTDQYGNQMEMPMFRPDITGRTHPGLQSLYNSDGPLNEPVRRDPSRPIIWDHVDSITETKKVQIKK